MIERDYTLLVGSYTDRAVLAHQPTSADAAAGISRVLLRRNGELELQEVVAAVNPSVIVGGRDSRTFYAVSETIETPGTVTRYTIGDNGIETHESVAVTGRSTCALTMGPAGDAAVAVSYWDGIIDVVDLDPNPDGDGRLGDIRQTVTQRWSDGSARRRAVLGVDRLAHRQAGPHPHGASFWQGLVFVPDLGDDAVHQYRWDGSSRSLEFETRIEMEPGTGPRQLDIRPGDPVCYLSGELNSSIIAARLGEGDHGPGRLVPFQRVSTSANPDNTVGELHRSPDGRFVLAANRGDDSITSFAVTDGGGLQLADSTPTGGRTPRHFATTPCGSAVIVANQDSDELRVFWRDVATGRLEAAGPPVPVVSPNFVYVLP